MVWNAYQVTFKLLSPMHIGWRKVGNLQQTRPYVTGRNLWGALTARLTLEAGSDDYAVMRKKVDCNLTYTYFYPSTKADPAQVEIWPWKNQDEFTWQFLSSYASTALADGHSSEEGSLHETEFISPYTREGKQVYLVGYIFEKKDCNLAWKNALYKLRFGGEQGYGWGRVQLEKLEKPEKKCFGKFTLDLSGEDWPTINVPMGEDLLAHTKTCSNLNVAGIIEPLVGLETTTNSFGGSPSQAQICYQPGSEATQSSTFQIKERGLWEKAIVNKTQG